MLQSADKLLAPAVATTVDALPLTDADTALAKLAERYAAMIDSSEDPAEALEAFGPKLLATLQALQATPAARSKITVRGGGNAGPNRLQALREARRA